jgi:peptidoglycan/xylan/chitin deacetylase (PgdA/CDA1 family)
MSISTEDVEAPGATGPGGGRAQRGQRTRRIWWWLVGAGLVVLMGLVAAGLVWGRPHVTWQLRRSDNHLALTVVSGRGPFARWLRSESHLSVGRHHGDRQVMLTLVAGKTSRLTAQVTSLWSTTMRIVVRVPPKPTLVATSVGAATLTLRFSIPVSPSNAPCGLPAGTSGVTTLSLPRGTSPCSGTLEVAARSGERAQVPVSVPARPPPVLAPAPPSSGPAPVLSIGPPNNGAFYITIDDGTYPDLQVLALMQRTHLPITAFLVSNVAAEHLDYWRSFVAAGGDIEDHTMSHPTLSRLSEAATEAQWAGAAQVFKNWFGTAPALGRPPYGATNQSVQIAASEAGLRYVVLWSASMYQSQLSTYDGRPLRAGEIVILHWIPGLYQSLVQLLNIAAAQGLHPAPLAGSLAP